MARFTMLLTAAAAATLFASGAAAQPQSSAQSKCLNKLNKDGAKVAQAQGKENAACVKKAGKGLLTGTAQACITADEKGKVLKKKNATVADDAAECGTAPSFGYTGAATVNSAAVDGQVALLADVFGPDLGAAVISCAGSAAGCACQQKVTKAINKLAKTKFGEFIKCKKKALKSGAAAASALVACVDNAAVAGSVAADSKGKIQKSREKLNGEIAARCDTPGVTAGAFPGACTSLSGSALGACLDARVECRVCETISAMDDVSINCDLFDDGLANASCTTGGDPPPTIFLGALPKTTGRFTYNAIIGISGADAACNDDFPGTHACEVTELQAAAAAGELVGATDTTNAAVTSFWAIDATQSPLVQCHVTVPWDYATAHTGHQGQTMALNNAAGTLGSVTTAFNCLFQHWVGCCL